jgi:hypothetical protein
MSPHEPDCLEYVTTLAKYSGSEGIHTDSHLTWIMFFTYQGRDQRDGGWRMNTNLMTEVWSRQTLELES